MEAPQRQHTGFGPRPIYVDTHALFVALAFALAAWLLWSLRSLWVPALFAAAFTLVGAPVVERLKQGGIPRAVGALIYIVAVGAILTALLLLIVPRFVEQVGGLIERVPRLVARLELWIAEVTGYEDAVERLGAELRGRLLALGGLAAPGAAVGGRLFAWLVAFFSRAGLWLMVPVLVFFTLSDLPLLRRNLPSFLPRLWREPALRYSRAIRDALAYMLHGQLLVALFLILIYLVGLNLSGVPFAFAISVIAGLGYFIPFATGTLLLLLSVVFTLLEPEAPLLRAILGAAITAVVAQGIETWILTPRIVGKTAGLPPLLVVVAVLVGGVLFGFAGVLFSLPVATALGAVVRTYREGPWEEGDDDEHAA
jgi:predicted PurR-regulated permease PerM